MKKLYIPRGDKIHYETLHTDNLVVQGYLEVDGAIHARHISGRGVILAGSIIADSIVADELEAGAITADKIVAHRVLASECQGDTILVTGFLSAARVKAGKLTVTLSEIDEVDADEVINLSGKRHSLLGTLVRSWLRSKWMALRHREKSLDKKAQTETANAQAEAENSTAAPIFDLSSRLAPSEADDLKMLCDLLEREGYTLRVVPMEGPSAPGCTGVA